MQIDEKDECAFCGGTGWLYRESELGRCGCGCTPPAEEEIKRIAARIASLSPGQGVFFDGGAYELELRWRTDPPSAMLSAAGER